MNLQDLLIKHEGLKTSPYIDETGHQTVGVGHNLVAWPLPNEVYPMSQERVMEVLNQDVMRVQLSIIKSLPWAASLDPVRYAVISDMAFNMGIDALLQFHHTLGFIQDSDWQNAVNGMLNSLWAKQVGIRAKEDAQMVLTGLWPDDPNFESLTSA